jgi:hypothetical protein
MFTYFSNNMYATQSVSIEEEYNRRLPLFRTNVYNLEQSHTDIQIESKMSLVLVVIAIVCSLIVFHSTPTQSQCTTGVTAGRKSNYRIYCSNLINEQRV